MAIEHDYETMKICVEAYLEYVREIDSTLTAIDEEIARIEERLKMRGVSLEAVSAPGPGRDALPEGLAKAAELREEWDGAMARHGDELAEAKRLCLPVHPRRRVLWLHQVERLTWDATGGEVGYSARQARRMAEDGVRELYELMPERWRREPIPNAAPL